MKNKIQIFPLTKEKFAEAVDLVLKTELDSREEIEHHLIHLDAHYIAVDGNKIIGVIGWYRDNVNYATAAMGRDFPGIDAYWVGFFTVDKNYRGKGIGYSLLLKLEEVIKSKKAVKLWVSSVPETKAYYERQNFILVKTGFIGGNKKYFMVKSL